MSTTGRDDAAGDPGAQMDARFTFKNGFNLKCGLPVTLLLERVSDGPWYIVEVGGKARIERDMPFPAEPVVAWRGRRDQCLMAARAVERFNGYETAREFPPK